MEALLSLVVMVLVVGSVMIEEYRLELVPEEAS